MNERIVARRISDGVILVIALALIAEISFKLLRHGFSGSDSGDLFYVPLVVLGTGLYASIGRLIVRRQPWNTIGWLLLAIPLVGALALANGEYATRALVTAPGSLPFGVFSAWVDRWAIVAVLVMFVPIFLVYPDGRLPSHRWRWVLVATVAVSTLTVVAFALTPGQMTGSFTDLSSVRVVNPVGVSSPRGLVQTLTGVFGVFTLLAAIAAGLAIVVRFRRSDAEVRQQIRWLVFVAVAFFVEFLIGALLGDRYQALGNVVFSLIFVTLFVGIPAACGIAILKYRLYDLDVVIRKTVVFGLLAVFITVVYAAVVGGIGALVGSTSNTVLSFVAAAVLAIAFQPARDRARRLADRIVYGKRATPYEVLTEFSDRMSETYATEEVLPRMAEILRAGTGAEVARVWLRIGAELRPEASTGSDEIGPLAVPGDAVPEIPGEHAVEVRHRGELLGSLSVRMPGSEPMSPAKDKLVRDLASQAGLVLRNVRLIEELRASRQRLVAAQDEERRRLERNLHDGAQQQFVALGVQLGLAQRLAATEAPQVAEMLGGLQSQVTSALDDLRDLARGIYPPLLADRGLSAALEAQARKSPVRVDVLADRVGRFSQEVEAAVYFSCLEALQNVAKYAAASRAVVRLATDVGEFIFQIEDDGTGFDPASIQYGTGLQGMADRVDALGGNLEVHSAPGTGTRVTGRIPIQEIEAVT